MTYLSSHSPDSARHNQLDHRQNGILDFDNRNAWNEGQAALDFGSGSSPEFEVDGANLLINASKISAPPNTVTLSEGEGTDGDGNDLWRLDHIYSTEDGGWSVLQGEAMHNEHVVHTVENGEVVHEIRENERAGGPVPKGTSFDRRRGELVFSILVPPDATGPDDFGEQHIFDRRREAIDLLQTGRPRQPAITEPNFTLAPDEWMLWPIVAWSGQTLRLWEYTLTRVDWGMFNTDNFELYIVDYVDADTQIDWNDGDVRWSDYAVWESTEPRQRVDSDDDPLIDIDMTAPTDAHAFVVKNVHDDFVYEGRATLGLQVTYTIEETEDL